MLRIRLSTSDTEAVAELDADGSAEAVRAFVDSLPIEGDLLGSLWSGHGCELTLPTPLGRLAGTGTTAFEIPVGALAIVPATEGPVLIVAYGTVKTHTATGPVASTLIGRLTDGAGALVARLERSFDEGAISLRITRIE